MLGITKMSERLVRLIFAQDCAVKTRTVTSRTCSEEIVSLFDAIVKRVVGSFQTRICNLEPKVTAEIFNLTSKYSILSRESLVSGLDQVSYQHFLSLLQVTIISDFSFKTSKRAIIFM